MSNSKWGNGDDALDEDEYLAQLLAKDARETSLRYSAHGMYAAAPKRPIDRVPRPNTRFLKNIIRDTDAHNASLKRKEEEEARERMRQLRKGMTRERSHDHNHRESKRRRVESPEERDRKRPHRTRDEDRERERTREDYAKSPGSRRHRDKERGRHDRDERDSEHRSRGSRSIRHREDDEDREHRRRHSRRRHGERRSRSPDDNGEASDAKHHGRRPDHSPRRKKRRSRSRSRSRSCCRPRHRSHDRDKDDGHRKHNQSPRPSRHRCRSATPTEPSGYTRSRPLRHTSRTRDEPSRHKGTNRKQITDPDRDPDTASASDSDPLSNLIGPLPPSTSAKSSSNPPVRTRGRGAYKNNKSNMDAHFAAGYDPSLDVHLEEDGDNGNTPSAKGSGSIRPVPGLTDMDNDWDMALEALRDRARWRRQGADRLREAGFEESVVSRFVNNRAFGGLDETGGGGEERDIADVRWAKKGEGREWDRGKVLDEEGHVDLKAPW